MYKFFKEIFALTKRIFFHLRGKHKCYVLIFVLLTILASFAEVLSIGALIPFLGVIIDPEKIYQHKFLSELFVYFGFYDSKQILEPLTYVFIAAILISACIRSALLIVQSYIGQEIIHHLSIKVYKNILYMPYVEHTKTNSSEKLTLITNKVNALVSQILMPVLIILNSLIMGTLILVTVALIEYRIAFGAFIGLGLVYLIIFFLVRVRLINYGNEISRNANLVVKVLNEGLGGIRDVLLDGSQQACVKIYKNIDSPLRLANMRIQIISTLPRIIVELAGMIFIALTALFLAGSGDLIAAIPVMGGLALGAQRLLPVLQQAYQSWTSIRSGIPAANDALNILDISSEIQKIEYKSLKPLTFKKSFYLNKIYYRYDFDSPWILNGISLEILKGSTIGIVGTTGAGKSTLLDIIMGLISPTQGEIYIDGHQLNSTDIQAWKRNVAHVPQSIFLVDASVAENVAVGVPLKDINFDAVRDALNMAQMSETIKSWPNGYMTKVGERGVQLSGGQKQRIGIARALYKKAEIIILDEATSALDPDTELCVMHAIESLSPKVTLIMVAHRHISLKNCQTLIKLQNGVIVDVGSYEDVLLGNE